MGEAVFRDVNERVVAIDRAHGVSPDELSSFLCECSDTTCLERFTLTVAEYERIRARSTWFALIPGHERVDVERVVERGDGYVVVEKNGEAGEIARELDPRD